VQRTIAFAWQLSESGFTSPIGHDGDEHGHDRHCCILDGGDLGTGPFADGLLGDSVAWKANRLEQFPCDPDDEAEPSDTGDRDRNYVRERKEAGPHP
jgi:hypothetical protein